MYLLWNRVRRIASIHDTEQVVQLSNCLSVEADGRDAINDSDHGSVCRDVNSYRESGIKAEKKERGIGSTVDLTLTHNCTKFKFFYIKF